MRDAYIIESDSASSLFYVHKQGEDVTASVVPMSSPQSNEEVTTSGYNDPRSQLSRLEDHFEKNASDWQNLYTKPWKLDHLILTNRRRVGVEKIVQHVAAGARILDAGCGAGLVALDLAQQGFYVHGVDIAESMLELCQKRFDEARIARNRYLFSRVDVGRVNFEFGSFGGIVALGFLEYQVDEVAVLHRLNRLLEPEGILVVSGPAKTTLVDYLGIPAYIRNRMARLGLSNPSATRMWPGLLRKYSFKRFQNLLESSGFQVLEYYGHGFVGFQGLSNRLSLRNQLVLHFAFMLLARLLPIQQWGNDLIVIARKKVDVN